MQLCRQTFYSMCLLFSVLFISSQFLCDKFFSSVVPRPPIALNPGDVTVWVVMSVSWNGCDEGRG